MDLEHEISRLKDRAEYWQKTSIMFMVFTLLLLCLLVFGVFFLQVKAPLSATTRGSAEIFCKHLAAEENEERLEQQQ